MGFDMSMLSGMMGSGGGGGGGMGGMSMPNVGKNVQKTGDELTAPYKARRARLVALAPEAEDIGSGIQPVASSRGGAAMANAFAKEQGRLSHMYGVNGQAGLDKAMRQNEAAGKVAYESAKIVKTIASLAAGGVAAGMGGAAAGTNAAAVGGADGAGMSAGALGADGAWSSPATASNGQTLSAMNNGGFNWQAAWDKVKDQGQQQMRSSNTKSEQDDPYSYYNRLRGMLGYGAAY